MIEIHETYAQKFGDFKYVSSEAKINVLKLDNQNAIGFRKAVEAKVFQISDSIAKAFFSDQTTPLKNWDPQIFAFLPISFFRKIFEVKWKEFRFDTAKWTFRVPLKPW